MAESNVVYTARTRAVPSSLPVIGAQPLDPDLSAIAALATTAYGRSLLTLADAAALRTIAALGTIATEPKNISARVYHNVDVAIPTASWTTLSFNSETHDTDAIHDTATNPDRLTCKTAGTYLVTASVVFADNATGPSRVLRVLKNGDTANPVDYDVAINVAAYGARLQSATLPVVLAAGDYVTVQVYQDSGAALNSVYRALWAPVFAMQRVA